MYYPFLRYGNQLFLAGCRIPDSEEPNAQLSCGLAWIEAQTPKRMPLYDAHRRLVGRIIIPDEFASAPAPILMGDRTGPIPFDFLFPQTQLLPQAQPLLFPSVIPKEKT